MLKQLDCSLAVSISFNSWLLACPSSSSSRQKPRAPRLIVNNLFLIFVPHRHCRGCKKRRSLRANSFFKEFPKVGFGRLLLVIYYFTAEDSQRRIALYLGLNPNLVSSICRRLQEVCSRDLQNGPITPFGGPGTVSKCDESKFNHKPKVRLCNYTMHPTYKQKALSQAKYTTQSQYSPLFYTSQPVDRV